jgi:hypothetical protein
MKGLNDRDIPVKGVSNLIEAKDEVVKHKRRYALYFLDFLLEGETSLEFIKIISAHHPEAIIVIVSGYVFLQEFASQIELVKRQHENVHLLDKMRLPMPDDATFDTFVDHVVALRRSHQTDLELVEGSDLPVAHRSHVDFPAFADFMTLSTDEQAQYLDEVYNRRRSAIEDYHRDNVWICFCGTWDEPALAAATFEDVPSHDEMIEFGKTRGFAPVAFAKIDLVDDVVSARCSHRRGLSGYPIAKLERAPYGSFFIHFDTGNPITMVCDKTYTRAGWLGPAQGAMVRSVIGEARVFTRKFVLPGTKATDASGNTRVLLAFSGIAVHEWDRTRFGARCDQDCLTTEGTVGEICFFRTGLLGRTFQKECGSLVAVDCKEGKIFFVDEINIIAREQEFSN